MIGLLVSILIIMVVIAALTNGTVGVIRFVFDGEPPRYQAQPWAKGHPEAADWFTANGYSPAAPADRRGSPVRYRA